MNRARREILQPIVMGFVGKVHTSSYGEHMSKECMIALIMKLLEQDCQWDKKCLEKPRSNAEAILDGNIEQPIYDIGCLVFESILEDGCGVFSNGHHRAQDMQQYFLEKIKDENDKRIESGIDHL